MSFFGLIRKKPVEPPAQPVKWPQPNCVWLSILCAATWGIYRKDEVRMAVFRTKTAGVDHVQAQAKVDGKWLFLTEVWTGTHLEIVSSDTRNLPEAEETPYRYLTLKEWLDEQIVYTNQK